MKQYLLAALLLFAPVAMAQEQNNYFQQVALCADTITTFTQLATLASVTPDDKQDVYLKYINSLIAMQKTPHEKTVMAHIAVEAWNSRGQDIHSLSMDFFQQCLDQSGQST